MMNHLQKDVSLSEVHGSIDTTTRKGPWWRQLFVFFGPAYLVSVGYMDPGNWATDLAGGSRYGYSLLWVLLMSNLMAILLQNLAARLGIVRGRDLAQANREIYPAYINIPLYILAEIAIAACDLAEVLGMAIGLELLTGLPLVYGVCITVLDTFLLLFLQRMGMRRMEAFVIGLIAVVGGSFLVEILLARPAAADIVAGFVPRLQGKEALYIAIGIIGATVMPHNLYLHSALVKTRDIESTSPAKKEALRYYFFDTALALNVALLVNAAILILAASVFGSRGIAVTDISEAHHLLTPLLGSALSSTLFAVALLAAGQSSTITGTFAGQIVMEGFVNLRLPPIWRRMLTRLLALVPAVAALAWSGESGTLPLLIASQIILSLQLPFAVIPLIRFSGSTALMGQFASSRSIKIIACLCAVFLLAANGTLLARTIIEWGEHSMIAQWVAVIGALCAGWLLIWISIVPLRGDKDGESCLLLNGSIAKLAKDSGEPLR